MKNKSIRIKILAIILIVALATLLVIGTAYAVTVVQFRQKSTNDSTIALREQKQIELLSLADNKAQIADKSLQLIKNQTQTVAMAAEEIFNNLDKYNYYSIDTSSMDYNEIGFYKTENLNKISMHLRVPENLLKNCVKDNDLVISAEFDTDNTAFTVQSRKELYLSRYLTGALQGVENFFTGYDENNPTAPNYSGIGASYFCFNSSGIDVLIDTLTQKRIVYDGRQSGWYKGAAALKEGEVFWTDPIPDGSGRGISLICAMPVYADINGDEVKELIGVAGSGGLIDNLREMVQSTSIGAEGYACLLNVKNADTVQLVTSADIVTYTENGTSKTKLKDTELNKQLADGTYNLFDTQNTELKEVIKSIAKYENKVTEITLDGKKKYVAYSPIESTTWALVTVIALDDAAIVAPINELISELDKEILTILLIFIAIIILLAVAIVFVSRAFSKKLTQPLSELTDGVNKVSGGDLDYTINIKTDDEIATLGTAFNSMTTSLKDYIDNLSKITAEKERIGAELNVATKIQSSMLPCIFPAYPERHEMDLFANMVAAKEVGGDFYDFFLIDDDHLALVISDVSGKGVPAALFMVIAKTLIKNQALNNIPPEKVYEIVNNQLCENNEENMFVTSFLAIIELSTGKTQFANAGHNPIIIKRADGKYEYLQCPVDFILAGMEGIHYTHGEFTLKKGDIIVMYTDGVTEALNPSLELYGEDRLLNCLNNTNVTDMKTLVGNIYEDIKIFANGADQADDITVLALRFLGIPNMETLQIDAKIENLQTVLDFVDKILTDKNVDEATKSQTAIAVEEIFANIAHYAYPPAESGKATLRINADDDIIIEFVDTGAHYNPLAKTDPDITLSAEERDVGGLGIYMVKQMMDNVYYRYTDNKNILTIKKGKEN